jgi:hypothetical protein
VKYTDKYVEKLIKDRENYSNTQESGHFIILYKRFPMPDGLWMQITSVYAENPADAIKKVEKTLPEGEFMAIPIQYWQGVII